MAAKKVDLVIEGLEEIRQHFTPARIAVRMRKHVRRATSKNASLAAGAIKSSISSGQYDPNSPVTLSIKGGSKPLVATGALFKAIQGRADRWDTATIGIIKNRTVKDADGRPQKLLSLAAILHFGATITVTEKMRRFFALMSRLHPGRYRPLGRNTKVIIVPPRPFLDAALTDRMERIYVSNWEQAIVLALLKVKGAKRV